MPKLKAKYKVNIDGLKGFYVTDCHNLIREGYESGGRIFEPVILRPNNGNRYNMNGQRVNTSIIINSLLELIVTGKQ